MYSDADIQSLIDRIKSPDDAISGAAWQSAASYGAAVVKPLAAPGRSPGIGSAAAAWPRGPRGRSTSSPAGHLRDAEAVRREVSTTRGWCVRRSPDRHGALPILTFVLTLGVFALAPQFGRDTFGHSLDSRKTMKNKHFHRSSSEGCAVSSVVEHFLDTEGVRGSNPLSRTIPIKCQVTLVGQRAMTPVQFMSERSAFRSTAWPGLIFGVHAPCANQTMIPIR